jgi:hypothetical protein
VTHDAGNQEEGCQTGYCPPVKRSGSVDGLGGKHGKYEEDRRKHNKGREEIRRSENTGEKIDQRVRHSDAKQNHRVLRGLSP